MNSFVYRVPTEVIFGKKTEEQIGDILEKYGKKRAVLVYGSDRVKNSGLLGLIESKLDDKGIAYLEIGGVQANPILSHARKAVEAAKEFSPDIIIGVGGGSVLDESKAIAHGVANPDADIWEFWSGERKLEKTMDVASVLTIAAAGSETSNSAVLTNDTDGIKRGLGTELNRPLFAIMDPELTYSLPKYQIACGAADIMMHTMERFFSPVQQNHMTDEIAVGLLKTVMKFAPVLLEDPENYEAASEIMWCGSLSHNGITGLGGINDFATHKFGHELSAKFGATHGASLTTMWGSWARYVMADDEARFREFGERVMGLEPDCTAVEAIEATEKYFSEKLHLPVKLSETEYGILSEEDIEEMSLKCSRNKTITIGSFRKLGYDDIKAIFRMANV